MRTNEELLDAIEETQRLRDAILNAYKDALVLDPLLEDGEESGMQVVYDALCRKLADLKSTAFDRRLTGRLR